MSWTKVFVDLVEGMWELTEEREEGGLELAREEARAEF